MHISIHQMIQLTTVSNNNRNVQAEMPVRIYINHKGHIMNATLTHLINNGKVITSTGKVLELASINVMDIKTLEEEEMTVTAIEKCEIWFSPEELEIARLKEIIATQQEHITKLMAAPEPIQRKKGYKHITVEEVREAEIAFDKGVEPALVASTYEISLNTAKRIQEGTHAKSNPTRKEMK